MWNFIPRSSRLSSVVRLKRVSIRKYQGFPRLFHQGQYIQPQHYFPQSFPPPAYSSHDIPWSQQSRWVRWPSYLCAMGIVGWWGWGFWHIEKASFSNRRRIMFYSHSDMAEMQAENEFAAASMLGIFPFDMVSYFATAKHVLNEAEEGTIVPVLDKLMAPIRALHGERFGKHDFMFSYHLVEETHQFSTDHSMWPGRMFITSLGLNVVAADAVGIATIMSHSLAHSFLNHRGEVASMAQFEEKSRYPVPVLVLLAIASKQARIPAAIYCLFAGALYLYCQQPYTNMLEKEADLWSLELMKLAGYDITKATQYWVRKTFFTHQIIDNAKMMRGSADAKMKKNLDQFIEHHRKEVKIYQKHVAIIEKYIKDNGILPLAVEESKKTEDPPKPTEEPKATEDPPKPAEPEDKADSNVSEPEQ